MGNIDALSKQFMSHPDVFAEFHELLFRLHGMGLTISTEGLAEKDSDVTVALAGQNMRSMERCNDIVRQVNVMKDGESKPVIFCLEIQSYVRYDQAVQNCTCLAIRLEQQVQRLHNSHQLEKKTRKHTLGKMKNLPMQRMVKGDSLPVIVQTVLYLGTAPWDAPGRLSELWDGHFEEMNQLMLDCPVNLVCPATLSDELIDGLHTDLRALAIFSRYGSDVKALKGYLDNEPMLKHLSYDAARLIAALFHVDLELDRKKETVDMYTAIRDMIEMGKQEERNIADQRVREEHEKADQRVREEHEKADQRVKEERTLLIQQLQEKELENQRGVRESVEAMFASGISEAKISFFLKLPLEKIHEIIISMDVSNASEINPSSHD